MSRVFLPLSVCAVVLLGLSFTVPRALHAQGVTTGAMNGIVTDQDGNPIAEATVVATHVPSQTMYRATTRSSGAYTLPNMRVGGPYTVRVTMIGFSPDEESDVFVSLAQNLRLDFQLERQAIELEAIQAIAEAEDEILNPDRTGAETFVSEAEVALLPSIKRSTRDLTRIDPRSDGNFSFAGRNWLYNNVSLDGSYFNNPFGLDDPAPGGQTNAEPVPYDAIQEVEVSVAPFDVRQGGFTGASVNSVTKSGTNTFSASAYTFYRNEDLRGNSVRGDPVVANPDLTFIQSGFTLSGPLIRDKLFFFISGEIERTDEPGTDFVASTGGSSGLGISRVEAATMDLIRQRMIDVYNYDPGAYQGFIHETDNDKLLVKLDWNIGENNNLTLRWNFLDAQRDLPPHPFVLSAFNSGRGPNATSLPFQNSGYAINNELHSFAFEYNVRGGSWANRLFASYNRFRDFREPFSEDFPTIEIAEGGATYTTVGHEPFSIHNILDQDVWQFTNDFSFFTGNHSLTLGATFEHFGYFNSFNIFRHGVFFLPVEFGIGSTFSSVQDFLDATDPGKAQCAPFTDPISNDCQVDFAAYVGTGPFKGENIDYGQLAFYVQDEFIASPRFNLTLGLRVDFPMYFTDPVPNPFSTGLTALDENDASETVDQASLPGATPLFSPRLGFNWNAAGERSTQIRGGSGIFTGRIPGVWVGNIISNPGANPNLWSPFNTGVTQIPTSEDAILQQSFDLNAMDPDFSWPQVWTTDLAIDQRLPSDFLGTLEVIYSKDINAIFMRNADLVAPVGTLPSPDGRPFYGGAGANELNPDGGAGIYVIDNTSEGWSFNVSAQLRRQFGDNASASLAYSFLQAKNNLQSTEIASVLWQNQPVQGDPNDPELGLSQFGARHRVIGTFLWGKSWSETLGTRVGLFGEVTQGNRFTAAALNRTSYRYAGDVNGDGVSGNDLIYIPQNQSEIIFAGNAQQEWTALNAFIEQDPYLSSHRGEIAERNGGITPFWFNLDLRVLQDFTFRQHRFQLSVDVLNLPNLISSSWGVRKAVNPAAATPLTLVDFCGNDPGNEPADCAGQDGAPYFDFTGPAETFLDNPDVFSRWRVQVGLRYLFN